MNASGERKGARGSTGGPELVKIILIRYHRTIAESEIGEARIAIPGELAGRGSCLNQSTEI